MTGLDGRACPECGIDDPLTRVEPLPRSAVGMIRPFVMSLLAAMIAAALPGRWYWWLDVPYPLEAVRTICFLSGLFLWPGSLMSLLYLASRGRRRLALAVFVVLGLALAEFMLLAPGVR